MNTNQQLVCQIPSLTQNKYNLFVSLKVKASERRTYRISDEVSFLICRSCFWCVSCLSPESTFTKCPSCVEGNIESLPIAENEDYRFNFDLKRGITTEFRRV
jgi:hypothetical protein